MKPLLALLLALSAFAQQLGNTAANVTSSGATVQQQFTASAAAPIAAIQFTLVPGTVLPTTGALGTKILNCFQGTCLIYGYDDLPISSSILAMFTITNSGTYGLTGVIGASPAGTDQPVTVSAPLAVTLPFSKCDLNHDGSVTNADVDLLSNYWNGKVAIPPGTVTDLNGNGTFNSADVQFLSRVVRGQAVCPQ